MNPGEAKRQTAPKRNLQEERRKARSLTITVEKDGKMLCAFLVGKRKTAQCSYAASGEELTISTGLKGGAYAWLAGRTR